MCGTLKTGTAETKFMNEGKLHDRVLKEPGRKNISDSFMWFYCSIKEAENMSGTLNTNRARPMHFSIPEAETGRMRK